MAAFLGTEYYHFGPRQRGKDNPSIRTFGGRRSDNWSVDVETNLIPQVPENRNLIFKEISRQTSFVTAGIEMSDGVKAVFLDQIAQ